METVILAAGNSSHNQSHIRDLESPLLAPMNGHTLLDEILAIYGETKINFVINSHAARTFALLNARRAFFPTINITKVELPSSIAGPLHSLRKFLEESDIQHTEGLLVLFGDTLIVAGKEFEYSVPQIAGGFVTLPERYSHYRIANNEVQEYFSKGFITQQEPDVVAELGMYYFPNTRQLKEKLELGRFSQMSELLSTFDSVGSIEPIYWQDLGHWDLFNATLISGKTRSFNSLSAPGSNGHIVKKSNNIEKITSEFTFLASIPEPLQFYFPRVANGSTPGEYKIEFWPLKTLAEYYVFWNLPLTVWEEISRKICMLLVSFTEQKILAKDFTEGELFNFYNLKLLNRLENISPPLTFLLKQNYLDINGLQTCGFPLLQQKLLDRLLAISKNPIKSFIHGDLCFSNILIDPNSMTIKLIDPRGSFCDNVNFGDLRYDLAKLSHSVNGQYDFIVNDMFSIKQSNKTTFQFELIQQEQSELIQSIFQNEFLKSYSEETLADVRVIEGMLFLSMIPLHEGKPLRQLAFLLIGLQILEKVL